MSRSFCLISLGCAKNYVDSEEIAGSLIRRGYTIGPAPDKSRVAIINTCAFLHIARQEALETIRKIVQIKKDSGTKLEIIILTGCLTNYYSKAVLTKIVPEIDLIVQFKDAPLIPLYLQNKLFPQINNTYNTQNNTFMWGDRFIIGPPHSVYVKIAEGCNNRCSYCLIPFLRGKLRSKSIGDIVSEVKAYRKLGAKEINIIAQDTTAYGKDRYGRYMLVPLLREISRIKGLRWIRLLYAQPSRVTDELIELIAGEEKICKYLDIPIQHIDKKILRMMGRPTRPEKIMQLYERIRGKIPSAVLRTTVMVGYPGEGEKEFYGLLNFLEQYPFERLGTFCFSPERRSSAYYQGPKVPPQVARLRKQEIMVKQKDLSRSFNRKLLGKNIEVLIDSRWQEKNMSFGRYYGQAPEVDGKVILPKSMGKPGDIVRVKVTGIGDYDLLGSEA
ncbi:MAG TPA: 30S ribosomal protein S12 methylthiotransferase RimO [Firmicutes bacterium]|jgi:ribosomal protein S12 methylthiotransferase|nr:30S ribosomal protein S12 methylthiotransferase RimO [Bacillota bacterium]